MKAKSGKENKIPTPKASKNAAKSSAKKASKKEQDDDEDDFVDDEELPKKKGKAS